MKVYHGSDEKLKFLREETYVTNDTNQAKNYGSYIHVLEVTQDCIVYLPHPKTGKLMQDMSYGQISQFENGGFEGFLEARCNEKIKVLEIIEM